MAWFGFIKLNNNRKTNYIPPVSWEHRGISPEKVTKGPHKQRIIFQASCYSKGQMLSCIFTTEKNQLYAGWWFQPPFEKICPSKCVFESFSTEYRWGPKRRWVRSEGVFFSSNQPPQAPPIPAHPISTLANVLPRMACSAPSPPDAAKTGPVWRV